MTKFSLGVCLTFAAVVAHATVINPGAAVAPNAITNDVGPGSTLLMTISGAYDFSSLPADISATYVETAFADTSNPFNSTAGVNDTTIVLKITVGAGTATIERATLGYFGGFQTAVSYLNTSSVAPTGATRDIVGSVIGYDFTGLTAGEVETLVVYTNSQAASLDGTVSIQDGTAGYNVGIAPAPEAASAALSGMGLLAVGLLYFQRKRHALM